MRVQHTSILPELPACTMSFFSRYTSPKDLAVLFSHQHHPLGVLPDSVLWTFFSQWAGTAARTELLPLIKDLSLWIILCWAANSILPGNNHLQRRDVSDLRADQECRIDCAQHEKLPGVCWGRRCHLTSVFFALCHCCHEHTQVGDSCYREPQGKKGQFCLKIEKFLSKPVDYQITD